ncbi:MAG: restriction endonuclease subunit S, partial [Hymenobacter sp.]
AWLGEGPAHWEVKRLKNVFTLNPSKQESLVTADNSDKVVFLPMENVSTDGHIECSQRLPIGSVRNGFTYFKRGDVLVAKITPCFENGKGACVDNLDTDFGFGSTEFIVLRANSQVLPNYLYLLTAAPMFRIIGADNMSGAAGQQRITTDFVRNFEVGIPPITEQQQILDYLAAETRLLDETTSRAQREIELIQEYRTRLVADVVTGRVDVRGLTIAAGGADDSALGLPDEEEAAEEELLEETAETDG